MVRNSPPLKGFQCVQVKGDGRRDFSVKWALQKATWGNRRVLLWVWVCPKWVSVPPDLWDDEYGARRDALCGTGSWRKEWLSEYGHWFTAVMQVSSEDVLCTGVFPLPHSLCFQWEGAALEGEHFAGEPSPNSVLQGVPVQKAKELLGVGWRGV